MDGDSAEYTIGMGVDAEFTGGLGVVQSIQGEQGCWYSDYRMWSLLSRFLHLVLKQCTWEDPQRFGTVSPGPVYGTAGKTLRTCD